MTGLVYALIIALWGIVLVPMWLRRQEESHGRRSAHRYRRAMEALGRKAHLGRAQHHPDQMAVGDVDIDMDEEFWDQHDEDHLEALPSVPVMATVSATLRGLLPHAELRRTSVAARRRRRVVLALLSVLAASAAGAAAGVVPGFVPVFVFVVAGAFVSALARQTRSAQIAHAVEQLQERGEQSERLRRATAYARHTSRARSGAGVRLVSADGSWAPVPTTLPTYVSKDRASKVPRVIDLTSPNRQWSGQAMVDQAREQAGSAEAARRAAVAQQFDREMAALEPLVDDEVEAWASVDFDPVDERETRYYPRAANQ